MKTYTVKPGDTLYGISKQFGVSMEDIRRANNLENNSISVGQVLKIPNSNNISFNNNNDVVYIVKKGDNLYSIAKKYEVSVEDLISLNKLNSNNLYIGQSLIIPTNNDSGYVSYTVQKGDNLYYNAKKYNTSVNELKSLNNLSSNLLDVDQILKISKIEQQDTNNKHKIYVVKEGDNLYSIAKEYNMTVDELKSLNNLSSNLLNVGQILEVDSSIDFMPDEVLECFGTGYVEPTYEIYTVKKGDNLYEIAKKYNTSVDNLMKLNDLSNSSLQIGQQLKIRELI